MRPKAILFDLDDTLISPRHHRTFFWHEAIQDIWKQKEGNRVPEPKDIDDLVNKINRSATDFWSVPDRHKSGRLDIRTARFTILDNAIGSDKRYDRNTRWLIADRCGALMFDKTTLFPDAISTLKHLKLEGIKLALVTNGASEAQRAKINKFDLEQYFLHVQIEGEAGVGKPELKAYQMAMEKLNVVATETWMVGDNIDWEIIAPQKLGIYSIWRDPRGHGVLPEGTLAKPDRIITRLTQLKSTENIPNKPSNF
ncbi:MAG: phosphoglycolate phosphatase [Rhodospirillaceae bacterium]|nr:phosphoglycolate phosphatase [Rhodospirillaceae bacterium]